MSRWTKNIVVPLESLCKEKESSNNRPTLARSVGTVGKWGKMGFTSTRTYSLASLPPAVAAAAAAAVAAAAASPAQSPASQQVDDDLSVSVPEPPKPKKFFKSRNAAPPEVIAQIIQNLPRSSTSPHRAAGGDGGSSSTNYLTSPTVGRGEPLKMKLSKTNSAERKKKSPKKPKSSAAATGEDVNTTPKTPTESKPKKKKEEKKLKPESTPSRVTSRARKTVNYCEEEDDDRAPTPMRDFVLPKVKTIVANEEQPDFEEDLEEDTSQLPSTSAAAAAAAAAATSAIASTEVANSTEHAIEPVLPPPAVPPPIYAPAPKTPEHPPIVLRISKVRFELFII